MSFDLSSLLKDVPNLDTDREQIEYIPLELINEDPNNFYQLSEIPTLADNIALCGLQQPIRLRQKEDGRYIIVSGHRRRAALEMLVADGYEKWKEAPCIVERDEVSPALQQLRLIYANANTRKMSSAEVSEQAEQVERLLYQLKEEGYDFPGRMRDHVAEAVSVSKSKLARLRVIRNNLAACWADAWKNAALSESQAYALAQMPKSWQGIIKENWGYSIESLHADSISELKETFQKITKIECQHGLQLCEHTVAMMGKVSKETWCVCCTGCCVDCSYLQSCKDCCPEAKSKRKELKAIAKKANFDAKREQEEKDRPGAEFARMVWERIGKARAQSGCSVKDLVLARGESFYNAICDDPKQERMEKGEGDYKPASLVSFGYNITAAEMMKVVAVADALNCSVDYLLGRTDRMELAAEPGTAEALGKVSDSDTAFQRGEPPFTGDYILLMQYPGRPMMVELWEWDGEMWVDQDTVYDPDFHAKIIGWTPMPDTPGMTKAANNESCITGKSTSGHCGAAACCANEYACCSQCPEDCNSRCGWLSEETS